MFLTETKCKNRFIYVKTRIGARYEMWRQQIFCTSAYNIELPWQTSNVQAQTNSYIFDSCWVDKTKAFRPFWD